MRYIVYPSYGEQRARLVRMTVLMDSKVRNSSSFCTASTWQAGWR